MFALEGFLTSFQEYIFYSVNNVIYTWGNYDRKSRSSGGHKLVLYGLKKNQLVSFYCKISKGSFRCNRCDIGLHFNNVNCADAGDQTE